MKTGAETRVGLLGTKEPLEQPEAGKSNEGASLAGAIRGTVAWWTL